MPASTVVVNSSLRPLNADVSTLPLSSVRGADGTQADFVDDELIVVSPDRTSVNALVNRVQATSVTRMDTGADTSLGVYRLKVVATRSTSDLPALLDTRMRGAARSDLVISSQRGASLLATAAAESGTDQLVVGINWIMQPNAEERVGPSSPIPYNSDARQWPYMRSDGPLATGVASAWTRMAASDKRMNRTKVAVFDGGFRRSADLPSNTTIDPVDAWNRPNPATCSGASCNWHGLTTSVTLAGIEDNNLGVAGSAGPHVDLRLVSSPQLNLLQLADFVGAIVGTVVNGTRIINVSAAFDIPASLAWAADGVWTGLRTVMGDRMPLVVAAAGNNGLDVDREDDFLGITWEKVLVAPCEFSGVLCVGGTDRNWASRTARDSGSAWGSKDGDGSVQLYAPYGVYSPSAADNAPDSTTIVVKAGTSYSAPFVAGVAAMVMAANPSLTGQQAKDLIVNTAYSGPAPVRRFINADEAVRVALGEQAPLLDKIDSQQARAGQPYVVTLDTAGSVPSFGSPVGATVWARDANRADGRVDDLSLDLTAPASVTVQRTGPKAFTVTPTQTGNFTLNVAVVGRRTTTGSFTLTVQEPLAEFVFHPGSGLAWVGAPYYASVRAYEQNAQSQRVVIPCSDVTWEVTGQDASRQVLPSLANTRGHCTLEFRPSKAQFYEVAARAQVGSTGNYKRTDRTTVQVSAATHTQAAAVLRLGETVMFDPALATLLAPPIYATPYMCGFYQDLVYATSYRHLLDGRERYDMTLQFAHASTPYSPTAAPQERELLAGAALDGSVQGTLGYTLPANEMLGGLPFSEPPLAKRWVGSHLFVTTAMTSYGMSAVRPSVIPVEVSCLPR